MVERLNFPRNFNNRFSPRSISGDCSGYFPELTGIYIGGSAVTRVRQTVRWNWPLRWDDFRIHQRPTTTRHQTLAPGPSGVNGTQEGRKGQRKLTGLTGADGHGRDGGGGMWAALWGRAVRRGQRWTKLRRERVNGGQPYQETAKKSGAAP